MMCGDCILKYEDAKINSGWLDPIPFQIFFIGDIKNAHGQQCKAVDKTCLVKVYA